MGHKVHENGQYGSDTMKMHTNKTASPGLVKPL